MGGGAGAVAVAADLVAEGLVYALAELAGAGERPAGQVGFVALAALHPDLLRGGCRMVRVMRVWLAPTVHVLANRTR